MSSTSSDAQILSERPKARLELPPDKLFIDPATNFVVAFAHQFQRTPAEQESLRHAMTAALEMVLQVNGRGKSEAPIAVEVSEANGKLVVELLNRGIPIVVGGEETGLNRSYLEKFHEASRHADRVAVENLGRKGQSVRLEIRLGAVAAANALAGADLRPAAYIPEGEPISIKQLGPGEAEPLSRLFYLVYEYNYIHDVVYYPDKLRQMLSQGDLLSFGAVRPNGRLIGHVGLLRCNRQPVVYEAGMGVVDPAVKGRGVFRTLFDRTMEMVRATPMQYCLIDFVTNHELTQKHVARHGHCDLALFVGCQSRATQARLEHVGLGHDPANMDRYSLLLGVLPRVPQPFGTELDLPESIGEPYGFLLEPLGLNWMPSGRFQPFSKGGKYNTALQPAQGAVLFDLVEPGMQAAGKVLGDWRGLLRQGFQYAAIDVPLPTSGLSTLYELLSSNGFFASGFVPYRHSDRLAFRFQALGPTQVAFEHIKVVTPAAQRLLSLVQADYEASARV